MTIFRAHSN